MTPNSQRSLSAPSPDVHAHSDEITCSSNKSERSSPAQFVPVADDDDRHHHHQHQHRNIFRHLRDDSQLNKVESFVQCLNNVLKSSPECSLAEASQVLQLGDLHMCLNSLLDVHKKVNC